MFQIKKTYNFGYKVDLMALFGDKQTLVNVRGILTADEAVKYEDIYTKHQQVLGILKDLPLDVKELTYILFETNDKKQIVVAYEYIDESTILEVTSLNVRIDVRQCSSEDLTLIQKLLREAGYYDLTVKVLTI